MPRKEDDRRGGEADRRELLPCVGGGVVIDTATLQDEGGVEDVRAGARGGREPDADEETANIQTDQGRGGEHRQTRRGVEDSGDRVGPIVLFATEDFGIVRMGGRRDVHQV